MHGSTLHTYHFKQSLNCSFVLGHACISTSQFIFFPFNIFNAGKTSWIFSFRPHSITLRFSHFACTGINFTSQKSYNLRKGGHFQTTCHTRRSHIRKEYGSQCWQRLQRIILTRYNSEVEVLMMCLMT